MAAPVEVIVDASDLVRGLHQLGDGLERAGGRVGLEQARATAGQIRGRVPVLTGRLRATVAAVGVNDGGATTYGGGLPYARKIERRVHAVSGALVGAPSRFHRAMYGAADAEVRRL